MKIWVTWKDINLSNSDDKGTIVKFGKTKHGGDCLVVWDKYPGKEIEECFNNLEVIVE